MPTGATSATAKSLASMPFMSPERASRLWHFLARSGNFWARHPVHFRSAHPRGNLLSPTRVRTGHSLAGSD